MTAPKDKINKGGRPTVMTPAVVAKLEEAFLLGCTDEEACSCVDISKDSLYRYCEKNPEFSDRKEVLKNKPFYKARKVISEALDKGDAITANKMIDRRDGVKNKTEHSGPNGGAIKTHQKVEWSIQPVKPVDETDS